MIQIKQPGMKIALIHYRLLLKGGLETRLKNYIDYFTSRGDEVTVICTRFDPTLQIPDSTKILRVRLGIMPKIFRKWFFNYRLKHVMETNRFDFSLSLGRTSFQDAVLAPATHLGFMIATGKRHHSVSDRLRISLDKRAFGRSKMIFAASQMMKDEVIRLYQIDARKIHILYPPLNTGDFNSDQKHSQQDLKRNYGMDPGKLSFLFVSGSHKRKGLPLLLRIFSALDPARYELFIAGDQAKVNAFPNIHTVGFHTSLRELYTAADITIHPAVFEPFGQIISESLQCGTPVMVSENTGAKEIVTRDTGVVVTGFNVESWLREIENLDLTRFDIPSNFATSFHLTLEQHCEDMLLRASTF